MMTALPTSLSDTLLVGFDAGGTKTTCLVARASDGVVLGQGVGGPGNVHAVGDAAVQGALTAALDAALAVAGLTRQTAPIVAVVIGAAGAARPADRARVAAILAAMLPAVPCQVLSDAAIALHAAIPTGPGVLLMSGTGSIGYGRTSTGREVRSGGWGYLLDDAGSAYVVGLGALTAIVRAADGRGPATTLREAVFVAWNLTEPEELVARVYQQPLPRDAIAALAPLVLAAARASDPVAVAICEAAGVALGELAVATIRQLATPATTTIPVATTGGFLAAGRDLLLPPLVATLQAAGFLTTVQPATTAPVYGAIVLAQRLATEQEPTRQ